ncbi:hypothetical protein AB0K16_16595 [Nonomuraea jabiensis]|uniref:hypothetical protein n=1 Tax=Nonomuraea jabiensis TaxID=882448 RepID=UPI00341615EE
MSFPRRKSAATIAAAAVITVAVAGCSSSTYDERMSFLRKVANRGVDIYKLLYSQESRIDKARCERAFEGNGVSADAPADMATGGPDAGMASAGQGVLRRLVRQRQAQARPGLPS